MEKQRLKVHWGPVDGKFEAFNQLQSICNLPGSNFFGYLQAKHHVKEERSKFHNLSVSHRLTNLMNVLFYGIPTSRHLISLFYAFLMPVSTSYLKEAWAKDIDEDLE